MLSDKKNIPESSLEGLFFLMTQQGSVAFLLNNYNLTPERLLACDLVNIEDGYVQHINSWEAVLQRVKVEYLGLSSNIQGPEIYSLRS